MNGDCVRVRCLFTTKRYFCNCKLFRPLDFYSLGHKNKNKNNNNNLKYVLSNSESVQCNFFIFDHVTFIQFKICCCVQNFIDIGWFFTEVWRYNNFQNGGRPPSWNCDVINKNTTDLAVRCSTGSVEFNWVQLSSVELCRYKHPFKQPPKLFKAEVWLSQFDRQTVPCSRSSHSETTIADKPTTYCGDNHVRRLRQ